MKRILGLLGLIILLGACGLTGAVQPTPVPAVINQPLPTAALPTVEPTLPPAPDIAPAAGLPAVLYYLGSDGQLWRLDANGPSAVTRENTPVTAFAVSINGALAYISNNDLYHLSADGVRSMLVDGIDNPQTQDVSMNWTVMKHVVWSPDGSQIAYGMDGFYVIDAAGGEPHLILADESNIENDASGLRGRFYDPAGWSPDGSRMLVQVTTLPSSQGQRVYTFSDGQMVELTLPDGSRACCEASWSLDGQSVFVASNVRFGTLSGLWQIDAATGAGQVLIPGDSNGRYNYIVGARQLADSRVYFFMGTADQNEIAITEYRMLTLDLSDLTGFPVLRNENYEVNGVLWADDGSGAVISNAGRLVWLPADGSALVDLGVEGSAMHWGP